MHHVTMSADDFDVEIGFPVANKSLRPVACGLEGCPLRR